MLSASLSLHVLYTVLFYSVHFPLLSCTFFVSPPKLGKIAHKKKRDAIDISPCGCGAYGTRTRDLLRDRQAF